MYRARDEVANEEWLADLERAADRLELGTEARSWAGDLFLSALPADDRSKPAVLAASLYAGGLVGGDRRSQQSVADAVGVSRLSVQQRWKELLRDAGLEPPGW
jgi:transcription initiation factor TFIIIB Brf1 subunit/transcription initiation factor TFIIB